MVASSSVNTIYTQTKKVCSETKTIILITIDRSFKLVALFSSPAKRDKKCVRSNNFVSAAMKKGNTAKV